MNHQLIVPDCCQDDMRLIFAGEYDVPMIEPPKSVLDIGGNVGLFSAWAAQLWPDATITSYEPMAENVEMARKNLAPFRNVEVINHAVRGWGGPSRIYDNLLPPLHSFHSDLAGGRSREVQCDDAADLKSAEFVKIDTEGSELEILERLDLSATKYLVLEAHTRSDANQIATLVCNRGFALHDIHPAGGGQCHLMKFVRRENAAIEPKAMLAFPTYGASPTIFWESLIRVSQAPPCKLALKSLAGDSLVSRARNTLTTEFLQSDCTDLIFIDSDLIFSADHIRRLMSHDVDVVAGFYPKKQDGPLRWVCNAALKETEPDANGLQEVRYMGTGFMRVRRRVFERMIAAYGDQLRYRPDGNPDRIEHDFWSVGVYEFPDGSRRYLSEDWYFCQRWLDLGGKVYGDTRIVLGHVGHAVYPLTSQRSQISNPDC